MTGSSHPFFRRSLAPSFWLTSLALAATMLHTPMAVAQGPHALTDAEKARVDGLIKKMTLVQKIQYIGGTGFGLRAVPELGIPALNMSDGPYGTRSNAGFPSTTYGAGVGLAASWDRELAVRVGAGIGRDARARGVHFMLGPGVNIYRSPRNGRNFEYFGEDPLLSGQIAVGYITGMQEQGVSATVKHYLGNNSEFLRHDSDTVIDDRAVHEIYLPAFEAAVKQGHVSAVMDSYNLIDGKHATENPYFNIDVLKKDWGFQGVLMSDWDATYDGVAAANGGLDVEEPSGKFMNEKNLLPAIQAGTVKEATIDEKVRRVLETAASYGWLDRDQTDASISYMDSRNRSAALDSAREGTVLLKNDGNLLPLDKASTKTILVVGPDAYPGVPEGGGSAGVVPFHLVSGLEGISNEVGAGTAVLYDTGVPKLSTLSRQTQMMTAATGGEPGVTDEMFDGPDLAGAPKETKVVKRISVEGMSLADLVAHLDDLMEMLFATKPTAVSHRFTGYFIPPAAGKYILVVEGSGEGSGNRVYVDGKELIDNWKLVRSFQPALTLDLTAGPHKVVVESSQTNTIGGRLTFAIVAQDKVVNPKAVEMARKADAVVIEAGYSQESESEGGDRTFELPYGQDELIREITAANLKTIVTITSGGNVDTNGWLAKTPALLETWYSGQEGGKALAEILFGDVNPSGHLPATFERRQEDNPTFATYYPAPGTKQVTYKEGIFVGYRGYQKTGTAPLFPFGYGLSYTTFKFANLKVNQATIGGELSVMAEFDVTNTGSRKGAEVAQLYVSEDKPKVARPLRELKGFERVEIAPGETKHVSIPLNRRSFSYYDVAAKKWVIGSSRFTVAVGDSVEALPLTSGLELKGY